MQFVIVTGISGAGRTSALRVFEDIGFFCVDNLPPALLPLLADQCEHADPPVHRIAVAIDLRAGVFFPGLFEAIDGLRAMNIAPQMLFIEASDDALVQRFKETRRKHPLYGMGKGILDSIRAERLMMSEVRAQADKVVDTTSIPPRRLKEDIVHCFAPGDAQQGLTIIIVSFGFKHGLPLDADLVFDVRFLANPYYVKRLAKLDGNHPPVEEFVMNDALTEPFLQRLFDLVGFSIPRYIEEGKAYLTIAIGCTGGRHRSIVVANELGKFLTNSNYRVTVLHRDLEK